MKRAAAMASLLALLAMACGSPSASKSASASRSGQTPPSAPAPADFFFDLSAPGDVSAASAARTASWITCSGSIGQSDPVAVVLLHAAANTGEYVLRDYVDPSNPRTACQFHTQQAGHGYGVAQLIDAHHVVIQVLECCQLYAVVDLPEVRYHWFQLPQPPGFGAGLLAVSPGLNEVAWLSNNDSTGADRKVHLTTRSGDQVVANLPVALGRCGAPNLSKEGAYAHSGSYLYVLDQPLPDNVLFVLQGKQQLLSLVAPRGGWPKGAQPEMAVWSPTSETLFYRQNGDVWQWTQASGAQRYLPGVNWYYPTFSPSGSHLAYSVPRSDGLHDMYLIDLAHGGSPQLIKGARNLPVFLNSAQLLYWSEGQGICGPSVDHQLVYDITNGSESPSIIDQVTGVWPATSSNFS
jgi:hypothetical protein